MPLGSNALASSRSRGARWRLHASPLAILPHASRGELHPLTPPALWVGRHLSDSAITSNLSDARKKCGFILSLSLSIEKEDRNWVHTRCPTIIAQARAAPHLESRIELLEAHTCLREQVLWRVTSWPAAWRRQIWQRVRGPLCHARNLSKSSLVVCDHNWLTLTGRIHASLFFFFFGPINRDHRRRGVPFQLVQPNRRKATEVLLIRGPLFSSPTKGGDHLAFFVLGHVADLIVHDQRLVQSVVVRVRA